jgi:two-component system nitrate/nitrite response regulator NarL
MAEGLKALLAACSDLEFGRYVPSLHAGMEMVRAFRPAVVLADKGFGLHGLIEWIAELRALPVRTRVAVWGITVTEAEALRLIQAGAKAVLRKSIDPITLLDCLRSVASGATWMEESIFRESQRSPWAFSELTPREHQVRELVRQGLPNSAIARELGIRPGTVKIHLKHIFEKTGIRGRHGLALEELKDKRLAASPEM